MSYTKGPWEYEIVDSNGTEVYARIKGIAFTTGIKIGVYKKRLPEEAKDNARLIATAPELLEVCKEVYKRISEISKIYHNKEDEKLRLELEQAIAKAERK